MLGIVGVANRPTPYDQALVDFLEPFLASCANILTAQRNEQKQIYVTASSVFPVTYPGTVIAGSLGNSNEMVLSSTTRRYSVSCERNRCFVRSNVLG